MLRDYQQSAVEAVFERWNKGDYRPCILCLATGAGKSWVIAEIIRRLGKPTLVLQPSKEILEQNIEKLKLSGVPENFINICSASAGSWNIGTITFATIGTIAKHYEYCKGFAAIIVDEADCVNNDQADGQYLKFFNNLRYVGGQPKIVGLTATPYRNQSFRDKNGLPTMYCRPLTRIHTTGGKNTSYGEWFWTGGIIYKCEIPFLQSQGYLVNTKYYPIETDWSFVRNYPNTVDFNTEQMTEWVENDRNLSRFHQAIAWCKENNLKTIVFTPNIEMNARLTNCIRSLGATAETMDSLNDSRQSRQAKMHDFRSNKFQFLVNVGMVGRGVDVPSVDAVVLARPTKSLGLYMQYVGRCLRLDPTNPHKIAHVIDLAGNVQRFGRVEDVHLTTEKQKCRRGYMMDKDIIAIKKNGKSYKWEKLS